MSAIQERLRAAIRAADEAGMRGNPHYIIGHIMGSERINLCVRCGAALEWGQPAGSCACRKEKSR